MNALEQAEKLAEIVSIKERGVPHGVAVERLAELLGDGSADVRAEAADALWGYPCEGSLLRACLGLARSDGTPAVRLKALGALGGMIREGDLRGGVDSGDFDTVLHREVKSHLLTVLESDLESERRAALESLAYVSGEPQVTKAIEALSGADDVSGRIVAIRCMGRSGDPRWAKAIAEAVEDGDGKLAQAGVVAAGLAEVVELAPLLSRILRGNREPLGRRVRAAAALGRLGGKTSASVLLEIAEDAQADEALREAANEALNALTILSRGVTT